MRQGQGQKQAETPAKNEADYPFKVFVSARGAGEDQLRSFLSLLLGHDNFFLERYRNSRDCFFLGCRTDAEQKRLFAKSECYVFPENGSVDCLTEGREKLRGWAGPVNFRPRTNKEESHAQSGAVIPLEPKSPQPPASVPESSHPPRFFYAASPRLFGACDEFTFGSFVRH